MEFVEPSSLEDDMHKPPERGSEVDKSELAVTEAQMTKISSIHQKLYKYLTDTDWFKPVTSVTRSLPDWVEPFLTSYTTASNLGVCLADVLGMFYCNQTTKYSVVFIKTLCARQCQSQQQQTTF